MKGSLETRLGLFFALVCIAGFILFEVAGGTDWFRKGRNVRARFASVHDLKVGDPVRLAGVRVGRVQAIRLETGKVEVTLRLDAGAVVKTDSLASIQFQGLMGQNFVSLTFGTAEAPALEAGGLIEAREQADMAQLMAKLEGVADGVQNITKSFSGEEFTKLLGPFTDFLKENNPRLTAIFGNFQNISTMIAEGRGTVGKLVADEALYSSALSTMTNLSSISGELQGMIGDAKGMVSDARVAIAQATNVLSGVNRGEGTLGRLVKDEALYSETATAMTNLKEIFQKINRGDGTVGKLVNDESFLKNVKLTLQKVDKATEGLEDTGPLSIIGAVAGKLF